MSNEIAIILSLQTANALTKMNDFLGQAGRGLTSLASQVAASFASIQAGLKLVGAIDDAIALEEQMGRLQERTGIGLETIEAMKNASASVGMEFGDLSRSLTIFNAKVYDAVTIGGHLADIFSSTLKVGLLNTDGSLRSVNSILLDTIAKFKTLSSVEQDAVAKGLFGRAGFELIPMFNELGDALQKVKDKGSPITEDSIAAATRYKETMRNVHLEIQMLFVTLANQLLPSLQMIANQLLATTSSADQMSGVLQVLGDLCRGVLSIVVPLALGFYDLGKGIGVASAALVQGFEIALQDVQGLIKQAIKLIQDLVQEFRDMFDGLATAYQAGNELLHGNISTARQLITEQLDAIVNHTKKTVADAASLTTSTVAFSMGELEKILDASQGMVDDYAGDLLKQFDKVKGFMSAIWNPAALPKTAVTTKPPFFPGPSTEDVKNSKEMVTIIDQLYQQNEKLITSNPFVSQADKAKELLSLIEQQKTLVLDQYQAAYAQYTDPNTQESHKVEILKQLIALQGQYKSLQQKVATTNDPNNFLQQWGVAFTKISNEWGGWAKQTAASFESVFTAAVNSISKGIEGLILKTKTWSQALREIGTSIIESILQGIIKMGVQWVLTQLVMAVAGRAIMASAVAAMTPMAAVAAATWSAPATLATIATYGGAAAQAPGLIAIAEGLTLGESLVPRAFGGPVSAGTPYIVGENRPEVFVPDRSGYVYPSVAQGGAAGGGSSNHFHVLPIMERAEAARYVLDHPEANHIVVETVNQNRSKIVPRRF
jgi:hypothetical protein